MNNSHFYNAFLLRHYDIISYKFTVCSTKKNSFSGLCYEGNSMNIPHYIKEHERYTDFWTCCENSFAAEKCFKEGPTDEPTTKPSVAHSLEPSSAPSNVFSPEPSIRPSEPSKPTISPTTFYWGAYMVSWSISLALCLIPCVLFLTSGTVLDIPCILHSVYIPGIHIKTNSSAYKARLRRLILACLHR